MNAVLRRRGHALLSVALFILFFLWSFTPLVYAGTGRMYLRATSTVAPNAEFTVDLRIEPGTQVNYVTAKIAYDASKLKMVSAGDSGTPFTEVLEENIEANPITTTRTTTGGPVSTDALIVSLRFKALASSGSTNLTITEGNSAYNQPPPKDPILQGTSVTFMSAQTPSPGSASPPPAATPSPSGSQQSTSGQQNSTSPSPETTTPEQMQEIQANSDASEESASPEKKSSMSRVLWIAVPIVLVGGLTAAYLIHRRRALNQIASTAQIDSSWAVRPEQQVQNTPAPRIVSNTPGVINPDPGTLIAPSQAANPTPPQPNIPPVEQPHDQDQRPV